MTISCAAKFFLVGFAVLAATVSARAATYSHEPAASSGRGSVALAAEEGAAVLRRLLADALRNNPEIKALDSEQQAAQSRIAPAGALDDPMLEAGIVNLPVESLRFNREDMTMKMIGLSQRLPYPGKRELREQVAAKEAGVIGFNRQEVVNRVIRDVKLSYFDLAFAVESARLVQNNRIVLEQFLRVAESRYAVGQATQADVLKAQTQLSKMLDEASRVGRERLTIEAELVRAIGRYESLANVVPPMPEIAEVTFDLDALQKQARGSRPQLAALQSSIERGEKALELARKEYLPDFDVRFQYGQRDRTSDGLRREDMVSLIVAINLPVWRQNKRDPRVAEAQAMRDQALSMYKAQENELDAKLRQQIAVAEQSRRSLRLYDTGILPQSRLAVEAALSAYRVNRIDLLTLLDNRMTVYGFELNRAQAIVNYNKALAEIDFLTGKELVP